MHFPSFSVLIFTRLRLALFASLFHNASYSVFVFVERVTDELIQASPASFIRSALCQMTARETEGEKKRGR